MEESSTPDTRLAGLVSFTATTPSNTRKTAGRNSTNPRVKPSGIIRCRNAGGITQKLPKSAHVANVVLEITGSSSLQSEIEFIDDDGIESVGKINDLPDTEFDRITGIGRTGSKSGVQASTIIGTDSNVGCQHTACSANEEGEATRNGSSQNSSGGGRHFGQIRNSFNNSMVV